MIPSSSSQFTRYGQINHYKKFWLLQTQLEKQDQSSSTSLSLGVTGNANIPTVVKDSKPLSSSLVVNGDHLSNNIGGSHGSCRADIVSSSTSCSGGRAGANFPYCSNEPTSMQFYPSSLGYTHMSNGSLRSDSPPLSLAVNCENNVARINLVNQRWSSASLQPTVSELHPLPPAHYALARSSNPQELLGTSGGAAEECESSECSTGGEKRGVWDITSSSHSTTTNTTRSTPLCKVSHNIVIDGQDCNPPTMNLTSLHEVTVPSSSFRTGHGSGTLLRTCSLCGTTNTPLWRSGPDGPKSLCNACGIRVKKSKRLQAAMEAAGGGAVVGSSSSSPSNSYKRLLSTTKSAGRGALKRKHSIQAAEIQNDPIYQKRKKMVGYRRSSSSSSSSWAAAAPPNVAELWKQGGEVGCRFFSGGGEGTAKIAVGEGLVEDSKSRVSNNIFAKDVEEAAVLLMALSCGLVLS